MKRIYVLGSLNCDLTISATYLPERGETLKGSDFLMTAGGKGANQAYACAKLGGTVKMAGAVGKDAFGDMLLESLCGVGVDISCIRRTDKSTGVAVITVIGGDNRIILSEGANGVVNEDDVQNLLRDARKGDIFVTQLENPYPVVLYGLRSAKKMGLYTVFNPAPAREDVQEAIGYADLILPNRKELRLLTGKEDIDEGCKHLLETGAKAVIVTLGENGSLLVTENGQRKIASVRCGETLDTTGAGDTFCGALCARLAEGETLEKAAHFASVCSGIAVTRRGAQIAVPTKEEVVARMEIYRAE